MGRDKDSYIKLAKKVCTKKYPDLVICGIDCVEIHNLDPLTLSWYPDGYTMFISIKNNFNYNVFDVEQFVGSVLGVEIVININ